MSWYGDAPNNPLSGSATHNGQQFPAPLIKDGLSLRPHTYATAPAPLVVQDTPSYVVMNNAGTYTFAYNITSSIGSSLTHALDKESFITASIIMSDNQGPIKLDIQPSAWKGGSGDEVIGDVTFVYSKRSK